MSNDNGKPTDNSLDIFGVKPIAHAIEKVTDVTVDKAAGFLTLICRPAAEEYGLLLQDKMRATRAINSVQLLLKAQKKFKDLGLPATFHAQPRLVARILEEGSWIDDGNLQDMWAGLLISACSRDGKDDSNLLFVNYLSQLTGLQARILNYGCTSKPMYVTPLGDVGANPKAELTPLSEFMLAVQETSVERVALESFYLVSQGLLHYRLPINEHQVRVHPTSLGTHLFVRCQGSTASPIEYFGLKSE